MTYRLKKKFFVGLLCIYCIVQFPVWTKALVCSYLGVKLHAKVDFDSFRFQKTLPTFYNVRIDINGHSIQTQSVAIKCRRKNKRFHVNITVDKPKVSIIAFWGALAHQKPSSVGKQKKLALSIDITDGMLYLADQNTMKFKLTRSEEGKIDASFHGKEQEYILFDYDGKQTVKCDVHEINFKDLHFRAVNNTYSFNNGKITGSLQMIKQDDGIWHATIHQVLSKLHLQISNKTQIEIEKLLLEGSFPLYPQRPIKLDEYSTINFEIINARFHDLVNKAYFVIQGTGKQDAQVDINLSGQMFYKQRKADYSLSISKKAQSNVLEAIVDMGQSGKFESRIIPINNDRAFAMNIAFSKLQGQALEYFIDRAITPYMEIRDVKGKLTAEAEFFFDQYLCHSVHIGNIKWEDFSFCISDKNISIKGLELSTKAKVNLLHSDFMQHLTTQLKIRGGDIYFDALPALDFHDLNGMIVIEKGQFMPSCKLEARLQEGKVDCQIVGSLEEFTASINVKSALDPIVFPYIDGFGNKSMDLKLSIQKKADKNLFLGSVHIIHPQKIDELVFGVETRSAFFKRPCRENIEQLWIRGEDILLDKVCVVWQTEPVKLNGRADFSLFYNQDKCLASINHAEFSCERGQEKLQCAVQKSSANPISSAAEISWDMAANIWSIDVPAFNYQIMSDKVGGQLAANRARIQTKNGKIYLYCNEIQGNELFAEQLILQTDRQFDFPKLTLQHLAASSKYIEKYLPETTDHLKIASGDILADVTVYRDATNTWQMQTTAKLKSFHAKLSDQISINEFNCEIDLDTKSHVFSLYDQSAKLTVKDETYPLKIALDQNNATTIKFNIELDQSYYNFLRLSGYLNKNGYYSFIFDEKSHFFDTSLKELAISGSTSLDSLTFKGDVESYSLARQLPFIFKWFGLQPSIFESFTVDAKSHFALSFQKGQWHFLGKLQQGQVLERAFNSAVLDIQQTKEKKFSVAITIDNAQTIVAQGDAQDNKLIGTVDSSYGIQSQFSYDYLHHQLELEQCKVNLDQLASHKLVLIKNKPISGELIGSGHLSYNLDDLSKWFFDGDFKIGRMEFSGLDIKNLSPVSIHYSNPKGLQFSGIHLMVYRKEDDKHLFNGKIKKLQYDPVEQLCRCYQTAIQFPLDMIQEVVDKDANPALFELYELIVKVGSLSKTIDMLADVSIDLLHDNIELMAETANIYSFDQYKELKSVKLSLKEHQLDIAFDTLYNAQPLHIENHCSFQPTVQGYFLLSDSRSTTPLMIQWQGKNNQILIESITGCFAGVECSLFYEADEKHPTWVPLSGKVAFNFHQLKSFIFAQVIEKLGLGEGLEFYGKIALNALEPGIQDISGIIIGKHFDLLGYVFQSFYADLHYETSQLLVQGLQVADNAGRMNIKKIDLHRKGRWEYDIPEISITEFRPSLLKTRQQEQVTLKPLLFREVLLKDLKGRGVDVSSITAQGKMKFINSFKRTSSIFDIPAEALGRIVGLDLDVMIPVCGDIDFVFQDGRCNFTSLSESYSENKRSKFFFAEDKGLPYIDFEGNINVHIGMKQYVLFKLTEKMVMSIGGAVANPKITMKKRKGFFFRDKVDNSP